MLSVIRNHHERQDGTGYPDALTRDKISLLVAIVTVADSYDAMTSSRAYRASPLPMDGAVRELQNNKGGQFNPQIVETFCKILQEENN